MGVGKAILCSDGLSNIVWSDNGPVEGPLHIDYCCWEKKGNPYPYPKPSLVTCFVFSLIFTSFFRFYISEEGKENMMDPIERKDMSLVALALYWCLHALMDNIANKGWKIDPLIFITYIIYLQRKNAHMRETISSSNWELLEYLFFNEGLWNPNCGLLHDIQGDFWLHCWLLEPLPSCQEPPKIV